MAHDARKLDTRIDIFHYPIVIDDELGTTEHQRKLLKSVWANIAPRTASLLTGREAETILSKTTHAILVRTESIIDMESDNEIEFIDGIGKKHILNVDYILPPTREERFTTIYCSEDV